MRALPDRLYFLLLWGVTLPVALYSYLRIVFNDDIHIYFGVAKIVDTFGSFPWSVDAAWETRPIGNRLIFYGLYKLFEQVAGNEFLFQTATKSVVAMVALAICAFFAWMVHTQTNRQYVAQFVFLLASLSVFTVHTMCIMQTEFFAVILSFLAIAMMIHKNVWVNMASGTVMVFIFLLKGITVVMIPVIFAAWWLITPEEERWRMFAAVAGLVISAVTILPVLMFGLKYFLSDFANMFTVQQATGYDVLTQTVSVTLHSMGVIWFIPVLAIGLITGIFVAYDYLKKRSYAYAIMFGVMWGSLILVEYIQTDFWVYHYLGLIIPSVISVYLFITRFYGDDPILVGTLVVLSIIFIFGISCSVWSTNYIGMWDQLQNDSDQINAIYHLDQQPSVLYLDQGGSVYFLHAPSHCRYIAPQAIHFSTNRHNLTGTRIYQDTMTCILGYSGEYVVMNRGWFGNNTEIDTKLDQEYTPVSNRSWIIYQRKSAVN